MVITPSAHALMGMAISFSKTDGIIEVVRNRLTCVYLVGSKAVVPSAFPAVS